MITNPLHTAQEKPQQVSWKHFKEKKLYQLELILPWDCLILEYGKDGGYMSLAAEVITTQELEVMYMQKGELIVVDFPVRAFERAWYSLPKIFKQQMRKSDNIVFSFKKKSQKDLSIVNCDVKEPTLPQERFATQYYAYRPTYIEREVIVQ